MTVINQLSGADQLAAGDSVPFYSVAQGDTRRFTMSTLEAYMADANFVYRYFQTWAEFLLSDGWKDQDIFLVSAEDTGTHDSIAGDVGEAAGQTPNVGVFRYSILLTTGVRISDTDAQVAKYWADQSAASASAALASANAAASSAADALITLGDVSAEGAAQIVLVDAAGATQIAAVTDEGTTQVAAVTTAGAALTAAAPVTIVLGRPTAAGLSAPTTAITTNEWVYSDPLTSDCISSRVWIWPMAAGPIRIECFSKSGDDFTPVPNKWANVDCAAGAQTIDIFGLFTPVAGERIGIRGNGVIGFKTATADSGGIYNSATSYSGGTFNDTAALTTSQFQIGIEFITLRPLAAGGSALATLLDEAVRGQGFSIGRARAMTATSTTNLVVSQWVFGEPAPRRGLLRRFEYHAGVASTVALRTYTKSGDVFTATGREVLVPVTAGVGTATITDALVIEPGQYAGFEVQKLGAITLVGDGTDQWLTGYYADNSGNASFTDASRAFSNSLQSRFVFEAMDDDTPERQLAAPFVPPAEYAKPKGHVLVWVLGQSNGFGTGNSNNVLAFPNGTGWKYDHGTTSIVALADPTGPAGRNGGTPKGSFGPAIGDALLRASGGQIGALVVNSASPATKIGLEWATAGAAWTAAASDLSSALTAAAAAGVHIVGTAVVWCQGENDAVSGTTAAAYKTAFADLKTRVNAAIGSKVPILMVRTGFVNTGDTAAYQVIRGAQDDIVEDTAGVFMAHTRATKFVAEGLQHDNFHYTGAGYDEIGRAIGRMTMAQGFGLRPTGYGN